MKNKKKVRTCGNCINCVKVNPTCISYSNMVECKYHEFKNDNYENKPI